MPDILVPELHALAEGETRKFEFEREGERLEGFVLRYHGQLYAYANRCPHWSVDLDMGEGRLFSELSQRIFCSNHGALFVPDTGYCDAGPCRGLGLERFEWIAEGTGIRVQVPSEPWVPRRKSGPLKLA
jgi:nitrite reductase/ring-hydroxylating ferredoxin subunit